MEITLYSTGCPRCRVLEAKLKQKSVKYMEKNGISSVPCLGVNGEILDFGAAVKWVNGLEV